MVRGKVGTEEVVDMMQVKILGDGKRLGGNCESSCSEAGQDFG
jgi:hypothetical protein